MTPEEAETLDHSLRLLAVLRPRVYEKGRADKDRPQLRLVFDLHDLTYDLPITEPTFLAEHRFNPQQLAGAETVYLLASLGVLHEGLHYKLVAGIFW